MTKAPWKEIALKLMDVLKEYHATKAFWYTEKRDRKEYMMKDTYPMDMTKIRRKLDHDIQFEKPMEKEDSEDSKEKYEKLDDFLTDLLTVFRNAELFVEPIKKKFKYSEACKKFVMHMLQSENIFSTQNPVEEKKHSRTEIEPVVEIEEENSDIEDELDLEERERLMNDDLESEEDEDDYLILDDNEYTYNDRSSKAKGESLIDLSKDERDESIQDRIFSKRAPTKR